MSANLPRVIPGGSESAAHLSALEAAHLRVEICSVVLEVLIAEPLSDLGNFSCVRLRLRKANVARTHAALDAAWHLIRGDDPLPEFLEPKQRELTNLNRYHSMSSIGIFIGFKRIGRDIATRLGESSGVSANLWCSKRGGFAHPCATVCIARFPLGTV